MKVLAINLLRHGDIVQSLGALEAFKKKNQKASITLVVYKNFSALPKLALCVDEVVELDREEVLANLCNTPINPLNALGILENDLKKVFNETWDLAINLTHDKVSSVLMSTVKATDKKGIHFDQVGKVNLFPAEVRYLNDIFTSEKTPILTKEQAFSSILGLKEESIVTWKIPEKKEIQKRNTVAIFPFSNEETKALSIQSLETLVSSLKNLKCVPVILCSPSEAKKLEKSKVDQSHVVECKLEEIPSYLNYVDLVISVDTLGAHLAASLGKKLVVISLGSSNPDRQRALSEKTLFIHNMLPCSPCPHGKPCSQEFHMCEQQFDYPKIAQIALDYLSNKPLARYKFLGFNDMINGFSFFHWFKQDDQTILSKKINFYLSTKCLEEMKRKDYPTFDLIDEERAIEQLIQGHEVKSVRSDKLDLTKAKIKQLKVTLCEIAAKKEGTANQFKDVLNQINDVISVLAKTSSLRGTAQITFIRMEEIKKQAKDQVDFCSLIINTLASVGNAIERYKIFEHKVLLLSLNRQESYGKQEQPNQ